MERDSIIVSTLESVPGYRVVRVLGIVYGSSVKARHLGRDIMASIRNIVGGELKEYTELLAEAREEAMRRMVEKARSMGANAVLGVRFSTSTVAAGAAEILVYGTAVVLEPRE